MMPRSIVRALSVACVGLMFAFMADTVDAQRRGGGGRGGGGRGGGGRSISRSGPASSGSFRPSRGSTSRTRPTTRPSTGASTRPSTQPSTRPSTGASTRPSTGAGASTRPSTQPGTGASTRPGTGGTQRPGTSDVTRPGQGTTRPGEGTRPGQGEGEGDRFDGSRREDWQDYGNAAREDWQDFYEEGGGGYYYGGYYGHYHYYDHHEEDGDWAILITGLAVGTALTASSFSSMQTSTKCELSEVVVNGVRYFKCGTTWYTRVIDGTNVSYVIVSAPAGY